MKEKGMPFSFLLGDLSTYKMILEFQTENLDKFLNNVPIIGAFHQQISCICFIYKRFLGSGISDLLVSAGVIEESSMIAMHHATARSSHPQMIEHCSRKWIPPKWKYSHPGSFEKKVNWQQGQPCFCVCRFRNGWKCPKISWRCLWKSKYRYE